MKRSFSIGALLLATCPMSAWASQSAPTGAPQIETPSSSFAAIGRLLEQGKYEDALSQLSALETNSPGLKGLAHEFGIAYYKKGDYLKAIEYLNKAREENPADNEAVQLLGLSYYLAGRPAEAIPHLEKVQTWFPRANVDAAYILGMCYIQAKEYPRARMAFAKMFDLPSESAASYLFTARMLLRQQFEPVAEEYARKAVSIDRKLPLAHYLLGELYMFKSRIPEAIGEFEKELEINPAEAATYYKLADAYSRIQKYEEAERLLQRSIWLDATSTGPYILMGKVLQKKGETDLAIRALRHAASMDPNNSMTHYLLGQAYRDLGQKEDAERELKTAEQLQNASGTK